jgi:DNA-binding MarR family transcriptional regulator
MRAALLSRVAAPRCLNDGHDSFLPLIDGKQLMPRILGVPFRSGPRGGHGPDHRSIDILATRLARLEAFLALPQAPRELPDQTLAKVAEALYRARRRRARHLPNELLGEPAWDILLDLFVAKARGKRLRTTSVCIASGVPGSTALRWLSVLEEMNLLERKPAFDDARVKLVELSEHGYRVMRAYLIEGIGAQDLPSD